MLRMFFFVFPFFLVAVQGKGVKVELKYGSGWGSLYPAKARVK